MTVITVCRNSRDTIEKTIRSVITQAGQEWELEYIIVDGASTDGTLSILQKYDSCITRCISEPDHGIFDAMNKGIGAATGDVIAFLNSDDWYEQGALKAVMGAFSDGYCDCVCCDNYVLEKNGQRVYYDASRYSRDDLNIQMTYFHSSIFCRKEFFKKSGNFDVRYQTAADYDWFLGVASKGAVICYLHRPVFTFSYGGISSVNAVMCAREAREIALRHLPADADGYREKIDRRLCEAVLHAIPPENFHTRLTALLGTDRATLWGAGARGTYWTGWFRKAGIRIDAVVDSNRLLWGSFIGTVPVRSPDLLDNADCNLIITPEKYADEIKDLINSKGNSGIRVFELDELCRILAEPEAGCQLFPYHASGLYSSLGGERD